MITSGGTTTLGLYDNASEIRKKADITYVDAKVIDLQQKINSSEGGHVGYTTLALANAATSTLAPNTLVEVTNDTTTSNNGLYLWDGVAFTKSAYDPLTQAKAYTDAKKSVIDENLLYSALSRQTAKPNLFTNQTALTGVTVIKQWLASVDNAGASINLQGIFVSVRLGVTGGPYPTVATDPAIFSGALRLQVFEGATLKATRNLIRLGDTDIWYFWDDTLIFSNISEIKVFAYGVAANNIVLSLDQFTLNTDGRIGNYEITARDLAISGAVNKEYEAYLLSCLQPDADKNLLGANTSSTASTTVQLQNNLSRPITKYSAVCVIETDGTYPTANDASNGFRAKLEVLDGSSTARKTVFLKRIGNSKVWYAKDADAVYATQAAIKITANRPADGTYISVSSATVTENSLPNPIFQIIQNSVNTDAIIAEVMSTVSTEIEAKIGTKVRPTTAFEAIAEASSRRIDIVGIGDSNQLKDGYGFDGGFRKALSDRFGLYATPPLAGAAFGANTGAIEVHQNGAIASVDYRFVAEGATVPAGTTNGLAVGAQQAGQKYPLNPTSRLRGHFKYATFSAGGGTFKPGARREDAGFGVIQMGTTVNTDTGTDGTSIYTLEIPANAGRANQAVGFKWVVAQQEAITGKFISYFMRVEDADKKNGVCISPLYNGSGQSLYDAAVKFNGGWSLPQLTNYFYEIRRLQLSEGLKPIVVIYINMGLNDQNETLTPSQGWRASTDPQSATAYLDNLEAVAKRIEDVWQVNGWDEKELYWWVIPSHPTASPDSAKLRAYRKAASSFAMNKPRASFVDFENLTSYAEMLDSGWYLEDGLDVYHLNSAGYDALSQRIVDLIK